jgi:hypothetical protein
MKNIMHFEQDRNYRYNECPKCHDQTRGKRIHFEDVLREEVNKIIDKGKKNK